MVKEKYELTEKVGLEINQFVGVDVKDSGKEELYKMKFSSDAPDAVVSIDGTDEYIKLDIKGGELRIFHGSVEDDTLDEFPAIHIRQRA
ncbi:hypothetical protein [Gimesia maris]|uniref:Uncharacterized protein n=1 Tax=Gimesia maris TaxID=122 RepID=A0ABX5YLX7_9PLAN|nr:hypothetical protein [Gimesia maris]EDL59786.1 hypothetical protein PM8797T_31398 [Gimesia maris DSM 8797]QEG16721.1 hypothetical protein GmarT_25880 [Gimesia maris]QGQ30119.1 hypothetical protein F1729_16515 [Gimesia maris]